jgi:hypothetical protein
MHASFPIHIVKQRRTFSVTTGLDPVVHAEVPRQQLIQILFNLFAARIAGSSPAMTKEESSLRLASGK